MHLPGLIACAGDDLDACFLGEGFFLVIFFLVIFFTLDLFDDLAAGLTGWIPVGSGGRCRYPVADSVVLWSRDIS